MREKKLSEQAYEKIRDLIQNQKYRPGDPLPENELSDILQMSRTPIREALLKLEDEQIVTIKPRVGAFVSTIDFAQLCNLYEAREAIDGMMANLLCKSHIPVEPFIELKKELLEIIKNDKALQRADAMHLFAGKYNNLFRKLCNNSLLEQMSQKISTRIDSLGWITKTIPLFPDESAPERLRTLEAIIAKNGAEAEQAARIHVKNSFTRIMEAVTN